MDKIENAVRTGTIYLKELIQSWEEELFANLIVDKNNFYDNHKEVDKFENDAFESYQIAHYKVSALYDAKIIDNKERDILISKFQDIKDEYVESKIKEVKV